MNLHFKTLFFPVLVCGVLFFTPACGSSRKLEKTPATVAESEELLAKKRKKESKAALKEAKAVNKNYWSMQSKEAKKSIKRNQKRLKKNQKKRGRMIP